MPAATITLGEYHRQMIAPKPGDVTDDWNEAWVETGFGQRELWDVAKQVGYDGQLMCVCEPGTDRLLPLDAKVFGRP